MIAVHSLHIILVMFDIAAAMALEEFTKDCTFLLIPVSVLSLICIKNMDNDLKL